jgi:hypothetical protein
MYISISITESNNLNLQKRQGDVPSLCLFCNKDTEDNCKFVEYGEDTAKDLAKAVLLHDLARLFAYCWNKMYCRFLLLPAYSFCNKAR